MPELSHMTRIEEACFQCLQYFALFKFPLWPHEVRRYMILKANQAEVDQALAQLVNRGLVFRSGEHFATENRPEWLEERRAGHLRALALLDKTATYGSIISTFPFVRGIAVSGSLSKFYASGQDDIDYFIVTASNRLWIARSLLHIFKKLTFITGHQHCFCMNFFVDEDALFMVYRNQYAAIELATLLPLYNKDLMNNLLQVNTWINDFLPNLQGGLNSTYILNKGDGLGKRLLERLLNVIFPSRMNRLLMRLTDRKWRKKWQGAGYDMQAYEAAFYTSIHVSKNHPVDHQAIVLKALGEKET